jgi:hypothetical protein
MGGWSRLGREEGESKSPWMVE